MLGRTNISDEESEQVRGVKTDGSMGLLSTFMGTNIQPVLSDVFWELDAGLPQLFREDNFSTAPWILIQTLQFNRGSQKATRVPILR